MKRLIISLLICSSYLVNCSAQTPSSDTLSETVYEYAEVMPEVEGGSQVLLNTLAKNIHLDSTAYDLNKSKIVISFVVTSQGQITDVQVNRNSLGSNAIESITPIIQSFKWHSGKQNGKPVAVRLKLPVTICFGK